MLKLGVPYLNWKEHSVGHTMLHPAMSHPATHRSTTLHPSADGDGRSVAHSVAMMQLDLDTQELSALVLGLEQVFASGGELRLDLPDQWIVFWKKRPTDSRLLLAHPQQGEWVATIALEETHAQNLVNALKRLSAGEGVSVHELGELGADLYAPGSVNNLELRLTLK